MHVECSSCHARYTIADDKIPVQGARVRCRKCQAVFSVERPAAPYAPTELPLIPPTPQAPPPSIPMDPGITHGTFGGSSFGSSTESGAESNPFGPPAQAPPMERENVFAAPAPPAPQALAPQAPAPSAAAHAPQSFSSAGAFTGSTGIPEGLPEAERLKHERARRLARVLASDIAIYNKEKRDRGLADGNLVAVLGYEIKKSWEVYKERVTPELANATPYFRDALNEMLAEGKKVF